METFRQKVLLWHREAPLFLRVCVIHHIHKQREVDLATMFFHETNAILFINCQSAKSYRLQL